MARPKGSPNKASLAKEKVLGAQGLLPRDYLLGVMRDTQRDDAVRIDAAKAVAPYVHPRLSQASVEHSGQIDLRGWLQKLGEPD